MGKILISPFQSGPFSLRVRTLLTVGLTLLALSLVVVALSRFVVLDGFRDLENRTAQENVHRALNTLDSQAEALDISVMDWAYWDDTYQFAQDQNEDYREANLDYQSLFTLQINVMVFFDASGHVLESRAVDLTTGLDSQLPVGIEDAVNENRILLLLDGENRTFRGVLSLNDQLMLVAARPILTSERTGPPQGILLFGRFLDEAEIAYLAGTVYSPLVIKPYYDSQLPADFQIARSALNGTNSIYIR
jgi:sensor domain CHASE-containing protein